MRAFGHIYWFVEGLKFSIYTGFKEFSVLLETIGDVSSAGSERAPHTREVVGSNPSHPTREIRAFIFLKAFIFYFAVKCAKPGKLIIKIKFNYFYVLN